MNEMTGFKKILKRVIKNSRREILMDMVRGTRFLTVRIVDVNSDKELYSERDNRFYSFCELMKNKTKVKFSFSNEDEFIRQFHLLMNKYY